VPFGGGRKERDGVQQSTLRDRDPTMLRKRQISTYGGTSPVPISAPIGSKEAKTENSTPKPSSGNFEMRPGQSALSQIGKPDHAGWLKKKGEKYNSWKLRYLVLKGPHLYYLRSNSRLVSAGRRPFWNLV
jgi:hypothetical protein